MRRLRLCAAAAPPALFLFCLSMSGPEGRRSDSESASEAAVGATDAARGPASAATSSRFLASAARHGAPAAQDRVNPLPGCSQCRAAPRRRTRRPGVSAAGGRRRQLAKAAAGPSFPTPAPTDAASPRVRLPVSRFSPHACLAASIRPSRRLRRRPASARHSGARLPLAGPAQGWRAKSGSAGGRPAGPRAPAADRLGAICEAPCVRPGPGPAA